MSTTTSTMTAPARDAYAVGDLVVPDPAAYSRLAPAVYEVTQLPQGKRGVNYVTRPVSGDGPTVKGPARVLLAFTGTREQALTWDPAPAPVGPMCPPVGVVVRVHGFHGIPDGAEYVVMGPSARSLQAARIVKLGGDGDRYWPSVPTSCLTVIPVERIRITD